MFINSSVSETVMNRKIVISRSSILDVQYRVFILIDASLNCRLLVLYYLIMFNRCVLFNYNQLLCAGVYRDYHLLYLLFIYVELLCAGEYHPLCIIRLCSVTMCR